MKIALAQTKLVTGDLENNTKKIISCIRRAKKDKADLIVFPETAITGYCCGALFEMEDFILYNKRIVEDVIAKEVPKNLVAVLGFVDYKGKKKNGNLRISNSAAVIQGGRVIDIYDKILLANGNHHEDKKYFTQGRDAKVTEVTINGKRMKIGTPICEDAWYMDHERDIIQEMKDLGAELILCPNESYFYYGKQDIRHNLFSHHAREKQIPVVASNAVGIGDIVKNIMIYDGGSLAYDSRGNLISELERFVEDYEVFEIGSGTNQKKKERKNTKCYGKFDEIFDALVFEQREMFDLLGLEYAQVHLSGGLDSSIVAALVQQAMGSKNSIFITNPTKDNSDKTRSNAQLTADALGVRLYTNSTQEAYDAIVKSHIKAFGKEPDLTGKACIQAVTRTVQGIGAYHNFRSGIVATGNHTEIVEGWATFHDIGSIGVHALIGDLTKTEAFEFAAYINKKLGKEVIPKNLYNGELMPAAELADAAEDPLDYFVRSGIDAEIIRDRKSIFELFEAFEKRTLTPEYFPPDFNGKTVYERYDQKGFENQVMEAFHNSKSSVFKSAQAAPIVIISPRSRGFSNRETIINKYRGWYNLLNPDVD